VFLIVRDQEQLSDSIASSYFGLLG
jgi:hypothetical protein